MRDLYITVDGILLDTINAFQLWEGLIQNTLHTVIWDDTSIYRHDKNWREKHGIHVPSDTAKFGM